MKTLAAAFILLTACGFDQRGSGSLGVDVEEPDAGEAQPDDGQVGWPHDLTCPGEECGDGSYTVCEYQSVHGHADRHTECNPLSAYVDEGGHPLNPIISFTCGACPPDPVCDEPCYDDVSLMPATIQCQEPTGGDDFEPRTVCVPSQPVFGDGYVCGACPGQPWVPEPGSPPPIVADAGPL